MSENQEATAQPNPDEQVVMVDDINTFVDTLVGWHAKKVQILAHVREVPVDTVMQIKEGAEITLTEENRAAFQAGIDLALMELGTLPFVAVEEPAEAEPEAANDATA